tara:strand:- start:3213 stop:3434 length:222 start_codon:yes stop_codon:yes gene_type:complete
MPYIGEDGHEYENQRHYEVFPGDCLCCCDEELDDGGAASERRMLAGMAHGNQGLADLEGLELDGPDHKDHWYW